jgi:predicted Zn finger-like uncharacterized protein
MEIKIEVKCPRCGNVFEISNRKLVREVSIVKCPNCGLYGDVASACITKRES